ncbi:hypothetical protein N403_07455 [Helicobacter pylori FD430]|nr:hypothetical protein N403_07455 [Helicobacter pylori FD430]
MLLRLDFFKNANEIDSSLRNSIEWLSNAGERLKELSEKFYKTNSLEMFEKQDQNASGMSEILGGAIARFVRFDDPNKALFEALKSDNMRHV